MRTLLTTIALSALVPCTGLAQEQRLGHVDREAVFASLPGRDSAMAELNGIVHFRSARREVQLDLVETLMHERNHGAPLDSTIEALYAYEINALLDSIDHTADLMYAEIERRQVELFTPLITRVDSAITEVATESGYSFIFDTSTEELLYLTNAVDLTPVVKAKLGID